MGIQYNSIVSVHNGQNLIWLYKEIFFMNNDIYFLNRDTIFPHKLGRQFLDLDFSSGHRYTYF